LFFCNIVRFLTSPHPITSSLNGWLLIYIYIWYSDLTYLTCNRTVFGSNFGQEMCLRQASRDPLSLSNLSSRYYFEISHDSFLCIPLQLSCIILLSHPTLNNLRNQPAGRGKNLGWKDEWISSLSTCPPKAILSVLSFPFLWKEVLGRTHKAYSTDLTFCLTQYWCVNVLPNADLQPINKVPMFIESCSRRQSASWDCRWVPANTLNKQSRTALKG